MARRPDTRSLFALAARLSVHVRDQLSRFGQLLLELLDSILAFKGAARRTELAPIAVADSQERLRRLKRDIERAAVPPAVARGVPGRIDPVFQAPGLERGRDKVAGWIECDIFLDPCKRIDLPLEAEVVAPRRLARHLRDEEWDAGIPERDARDVAIRQWLGQDHDVGLGVIRLPVGVACARIQQGDAPRDAPPLALAAPNLDKHARQGVDRLLMPLGPHDTLLRVLWQP